MDGVKIATSNIAVLLEYREILDSTEYSTESSPYQVRWLFT